MQYWRPSRQSDPDKALTFSWNGVANADLIDARFVITGNVKRQKCRLAIISELLRAAREGRWLRYSRRKEHYSVLSAYAAQGFTYTNVMAVVEELLEMQWIKEERSRPGDLYWQSRMRARPEMLQRLRTCTNLIHVPVELIILKDADGRVTWYSQTEQVRRWRREVATLNEAFSSVQIIMPLEHRPDEAVWLDPTPQQTSRVRGYRVFNNSWKRGGRLYGPFWQSLPKKDRLNITIDGVSVDEFDYQHIHPRILYALHGKVLTGDAYTIRGLEDKRDLIKKAWQIVVNSKSPLSAKRALMHELKCTADHANSILLAIEEHHDEIQGSFYSCAGALLQSIDSQLMMSVELAALSDGIVALPIHDSFIVQTGSSACRISELMDNFLIQTLHRITP